MSVKSLLVSISIALAGIACIIAAVGLGHELLSAKDPHLLVHGLEEWAVTVGYHLALILLAAGALQYLAHKK